MNRMQNHFKPYLWIYVCIFMNNFDLGITYSNEESITLTITWLMMAAMVLIVIDDNLEK